MLKIKDNVDLKELEKFGIKEAPDVKGSYGLCKKWDNLAWYYTISFEEKDRIIEMINYNYETVEVLYELIKADMVEKID